MKARTLVMLTALVTALSGLVGATSAAGAAPPPTLSLYTSQITVHTSNGKAWKFGLSAYQAGPSDQLRLDLVRNVGHSSESHNWYVPAPSSTLTFNRSTQHGSIKTPQSTSPLTTINLSFAATGHHAVHCMSGSETIYNGNLTGRATLTTHLKGGGTVGGQHLTFTANGTQLYADNNCQSRIPVSNRCSKSSFYNVSGAHNRSLYGFGSPSSSFIQVSHSVSIAHPAGATRSDSASANAPTPTLTKAAKTLHVFGSSSGLVTGSGRIVAKKLDSSSASCKLNGNKHTEVQYLSENGKFTNTSGHPIVGHTNLTGRLTVANGGSAYFDYETWH
jgi:hypothetical protein